MIELTQALVPSVLVGLVYLGAGFYFRTQRRFIPAMVGSMLGMTSGMLGGLLIGCLLGAATDMFVSNLAGIAAGLVLGVGLGCFGGLMGALEGAMGGIMGGMMGAMLGVMVGPASKVWITSGVLALLNVLGLLALQRLVARQKIGPTAVDPVCDMLVEIDRARWTSRIGEEVIYFCAPICKREFDDNPQPYLGRMRREEIERGM